MKINRIDSGEKATPNTSKGQDWKSENDNDHNQTKGDKSKGKDTQKGPDVVPLLLQKMDSMQTNLQGHSEGFVINLIDSKLTSAKRALPSETNTSTVAEKRDEYKITKRIGLRISEK